MNTLYRKGTKTALKETFIKRKSVQKSVAILWALLSMNVLYNAQDKSTPNRLENIVLQIHR